MFFLGFGVLLLVGAVMFTVGTSRFLARAQSAPGTVVDLQAKRDSDGDTMYKPVVTFTPSGHDAVTFTSTAASRPAAYSVGDAVEVLYLPADPQQARIRGFISLWLASVVLGGMGVVFTGIGAAFIVQRRSAENRKNFLMAYGTAIETRFQAVERNTSLEVNGRNPWRIVSQWQNPASGNLRVFNSENLWFDPTQYVKPGKITVLLDPADGRRYHMDVSFLPKLEDA